MVCCAGWEQHHYPQYPPLAFPSRDERDIKVILRNGNTEQIENALLDKEIETGIVDSRKIKRLNTCRF
jgi:hypothetical protein